MGVFRFRWSLLRTFRGLIPNMRWFCRRLCSFRSPTCFQVYGSNGPVWEAFRYLKILFRTISEGFFNVRKIVQRIKLNIWFDYQTFRFVWTRSVCRKPWILTKMKILAFSLYFFRNKNIFYRRISNSRSEQIFDLYRLIVHWLLNLTRFIFIINYLIFVCYKHFWLIGIRSITIILTLDIFVIIFRSIFIRHWNVRVFLSICVTIINITKVLLKRICFYLKIRSKNPLNNHFSYKSIYETSTVIR